MRIYDRNITEIAKFANDSMQDALSPGGAGSTPCPGLAQRRFPSPLVLLV
jgi:hypothetical protein